jgi:hypothetical protein
MLQLWPWPGFMGVSMNMTAPKRQLLHQGLYILGLLFLSAILGIIVSVTTNYFVSTVKWFFGLRNESVIIFQLNGFSFRKPKNHFTVLTK